MTRRLVAVLIAFSMGWCTLAPTADSAYGVEQGQKKIVFVAGRKSHGYGAHEHYAGCMLLAKALQAAMPDYKCVVSRDGFPQDTSVFDDCDAVVFYADGGGGHPVNPHLAEIDALAEKGVGIACIHYAVEVPKGDSGDHFLKWIGGYFETHWSVNPHWNAHFDKLPDHPVSRGVEPFEADDEWYYHMRFREDLQGVTPILSAMPGPETLRRPDGAHSGNPDVRAAVLDRNEPQHVAWVSERENGQRGFGFTGGHWHWNWAEPNFRKVALNGIVWVAHGEVPAAGVTDRPVKFDQLLENQDYDQPPAPKLEEIRTRYKLDADQANTSKRGAATEQVQSSQGDAKPIYSSPVVTTATPGHAIEIDVPLAGAKQLFLAVTDGGNGYGCDWADWAEPRLVGPAGEKKLTQLKWKSAAADWGQVHVDRNAGGGSLRIDGKDVAYGIGTHANSLIAFDVPEGYDRFQARGGLDNGGTDQSGGGSTSVQFYVFTSPPPTSFTRSQSGGGGGGSREPEDAVAGLDVADGLEATLFASEPDLLSLTNLDIDHRGRIWVCEVVNYRGNNGKRPEGDRILILEDKDGDGVADETKVYFQGREVDSAMGICVLGNQVIVSCSPNVWVFTDDDGDDHPDRRELLFTNSGHTQHYHSAHTFLFGPDGKMYWNFGNTGQAVHDREGNIVVDMAGHEVRDARKPYIGGMAFRCNRDGSEFEVLGHNFRNNYEVTVDSYGTLWQSDNDDDGNRGVRINYVMEFGNFGYRDEMTGAGWNSERTGMSTEIPLRHWHLNDPGVVPNLLQTGAGSPTGIMVYEGRLLPKVFWDQVIHCDAGPNVVRAYPVTDDGAGYAAEVVNVLHGARDNWFRPADVCVAPDGSVFVTDWYDPGVGGHAMRDLERGRLFRVAPPGCRYEIPKFDFSTPEGAAEALRNPNLATRYMAWTALHEMGDDADAALRKLRADPNPRIRARAIWVQGKMNGRGAEVVGEAIRDEQPELRIVGIRLARQLKMEMLPIVQQLVQDGAPQVRRELAIALRHHASPEAAELWAELAAQHDGKDRWYLEALGIGADGQWDTYLAAWLKHVGSQWNTAAGRDIVWRSRAQATPDYLAQIITDPAMAPEELPRYYRAFDFLTGEGKEKALRKILGLE